MGEEKFILVGKILSFRIICLSFFGKFAWVFFFLIFFGLEFFSICPKKACIMSGIRKGDISFFEFQFTLWVNAVNLAPLAIQVKHQVEWLWYKFRLFLRLQIYYVGVIFPLKQLKVKRWLWPYHAFSFIVLTTTSRWQWQMPIGLHGRCISLKPMLTFLAFWVLN